MERISPEGFQSTEAPEAVATTDAVAMPTTTSTRPALPPAQGMFDPAENRDA